MNFNELVEKINNLDENNKENIKQIVSNIDINGENFDEWVDKVFSDNIDSFNMSKLPYLIDELYQTDDKIKFMLCCMLLEATCFKIDFITNLEKYPIYSAKFDVLANTLVTIYDMVDNGIANCMTMIILDNDPTFEHFTEEQINILKEATKRKLSDILDYLTEDGTDTTVYDDLEIIADLACYLKDEEINELVKKLSNLKLSNNALLFIIKYMIINELEISNDNLNNLINDNEVLIKLYSIMERLGVKDNYLTNITQEQLALSDMVRWLAYPTELGSKPDKIELLGEFIFNDQKCYAYKFSKEDFSIKGELLGISGGYPMDKISSTSSGYTFSKFELVRDDWKEQAIDLANFIAEYWKQRGE